MRHTIAKKGLVAGTARLMYRWRTTKIEYFPLWQAPAAGLGRHSRIGTARTLVYQLLHIAETAQNIP